MDTKSTSADERDKAYEEMVKDCRRIKIAKTIAIIITVVMISISLISIKDIRVNSSIFDERSLYGSKFLGSEINAFTEKVLEVIELYKTDEYIKDVSNLSQEEIQWKKEAISKKIQEEYDNERNKLHEKYDSNWDEEKVNKEEEAIYKKIEEKYIYSDEELKKLIVEEKLVNFNKYIKTLDSYTNLKYIAYDKANDIWLTNYKPGKDAIAELKESSGFFSEYHISNGVENKNIFINGQLIKDKELNDYGYYNEGDGTTVLEVTDSYRKNGNSYTNKKSYRVKGDLDIYVAVTSELVAGDSIYNTYEKFLQANSVVDTEIGILIASLFGVAIMIFVLRKFRYKPCYSNRIVEKLKDMPLEIKLLGIVMGWITYHMFFRYNWSNEYRYTININNIVLVTFILIAYYLIIKALLQNYKESTLLKDSYGVKLYNHLCIAMEKGTLGRKLILVIGVYVAICTSVSLILMIILEAVGAVIALGFDIVATAIVIYKLVKEFAYLNKITNGAKLISEGKINDDISEEGKGALRDLAHSINNMKQGLRKSIENENKSEKMKTELISNVSHDLKTPLTSIINYVDLLKRMGIEPEEARAYVEVLDRKSQRLKILIEDLFEASKAASGAMQLNFEKIELNALVRQSLGEAENRIQVANLDFKTNIPTEKIYINADGRKIWRVFENLISNAIKYSLKGTRVYVDVKSENNKVYITMKNISAYELNFDATEITERFKRGEESRNTEGSGLGLAIAKSIIELHDGDLEIGIDGDLFKVTVELNIYE
ncbi:HAMP domain-containing sensor histidine kinase [uncultured Clostridium sp.]|uniref:HAMP domain-containing sensor histidine kinase n=1 Tax=uncultured Clostridium sp. TaxID=59620 RepID=UPI003216B373